MSTRHKPDDQVSLSDLPDFTIPCGYTQHGQVSTDIAAVWAVWYRRPPCGCNRRYDFQYYCARCWAWRNARGEVRCTICGHKFPSMQDVIRVEHL